jgi:hypothetical protein
MKLPGKSVGSDHSFRVSKLYLSVSKTPSACGPNPAFFSFFNFIPKSFHELIGIGLISVRQGGW